MLNRKDRERLIAALDTALTLYVAGKDNQKHFATIIGQALDVPFLDHFVAACVSEVAKTS